MSEEEVPHQMGETLTPDRRLWEDLREIVYRENEVTNQRTTWLMVAQALLANAAAQTLPKYPWITVGVAVVAILLTISIGHALRNSFETRQHYKAMWKRLISERGYALDVHVLPLDGAFPDNNAKRALLPNNFMPGVFIGAWFALIVYVIAGLPSFQNVNPFLLNLAGLICNAAAALILFFYGFPQPSFDEGVGIGLEDNTPLENGETVAERRSRVRSFKRRYLTLSRVGFLLLLIGFTLQLGAIVRTPS